MDVTQTSCSLSIPAKPSLWETSTQNHWQGRATIWPTGLGRDKEQQHLNRGTPSQVDHQITTQWLWIWMTQPISTLIRTKFSSQKCNVTSLEETWAPPRIQSKADIEDAINKLEDGVTNVAVLENILETTWMEKPSLKSITSSKINETKSGEQFRKQTTH